MRLIDADKLMDNLRGNVLVDVTPALEDAVAEQLDVHQWIPVRERLPEDIGGVLVCLDNGLILIARYGQNSQMWYMDITLAAISGVIAWMPLPKTFNP